MIFTPPKTNMTMEKTPFLRGDTSSSNCFSIGMLVFGGVRGQTSLQPFHDKVVFFSEILAGGPEASFG